MREFSGIGWRFDHRSLLVRGELSDDDVVVFCAWT